MDGWVCAARRALARAPTRALPFPVLLQELEAEGVRTRGMEEWILQKLEGHPELFLLVSERLGPWAGPTPEPWVLLQEDLPTGFGPLEQALRRVQTGLVAWGKALDRGSQAAVARWIRGNQEAGAILRALTGH